MADPIRGSDDLSDEEREALERLLYRLADDELVIAERYTEWAVYAPTLESDLALANVAQDELGHARLWYDLLMDFGEDERTLIFDRDPETFRHSTLAELPFEEGDWADAIVRSYLYDIAEDIRLDALAETRYRPLADRVGKVRSEENYHREHAQNWVERLSASDDSHDRLQEAVDRLFPHALTIFEPTGDVDASFVDLGLQTRSLAEMREDWLDIVVPFLQSHDLSVPAESDDALEALVPDTIGRDTAHTDAWFELHDEMTNTYRELDRPEPATIMDEPQ